MSKLEPNMFHIPLSQTVPTDSLQSGVLYSPADEMLRRAIAKTLDAPIADRTRLFAQFVAEIESFVAKHYQQRPWTCRIYTGADGSRIFRGGVGHSLVIDAMGRLWRARSYEDFETGYSLEGGLCEISSLTPLYEQMREYKAGEAGFSSVEADDLIEKARNPG